MNLKTHFENLRKAQLQEYFLRWFPNEPMLSDRKKLIEQLGHVMSDPKTIRDKFDRLCKSYQDFIVALLSCDSFQGTLNDIQSQPCAQSIESYEIENLIRNLSDEGWVVKSTVQDNGTRQKLYSLLNEVGMGLSSTVSVESREPAQMLSYALFKASKNEQNGNLDTRDFLERIESLNDSNLKEAVQEALDEYEGIYPLNSRNSSETNGQSLEDRSQWRSQLEEAGLGTVGVLSLKSFGIDLEEECLIIFQEHVREYAIQSCEQESVENDLEYCLGVDLLIDIRRLIELARTEAVEITREGTVFKKTEERIAERLLTPQYESLFEGSAVDHIILICKRLRLLVQDDHHLRADRKKRGLWVKKRILTMLKTVYELYNSETRSKHWSFQQTRLRELFLGLMTDGKSGVKFSKNLMESRPLGEWILAKPLLTAVTSQYLTQLEETQVADELKELKMEEFHHGALMVTRERLAQDLSYWLIHRLAVLGLIDLGFKKGKFHSIRLSTLGCRFFKINLPDSGDGELVINPDYEILLFPGGKDEAEVNYNIGSFADRTGTDWVKRYRVTRRSVKRGIIGGQGAEDILKFLKKRSSRDLPPNVEFSIREWAEGVEPILKQKVILLKARTEAGAEMLSEILTENDIAHERLGPIGVVLRSTLEEKAVLGIRETLRAAGLFLE